MSTVQFLWKDTDTVLYDTHCRCVYWQVLNKDLSLREAATAYNVPKSTLARRAIGKNKYVTGAKKHLGRFLPDFLPEYEEEYIWQATSKRWKPVSLG